MMKSIGLNVAIAPPKHIVDQAIKISKSLASYGGFFVLDERLYSTHITLYMSEFPEKNIPNICDALEALASKTTPFKIKSLHYNISENGFIDVAFEKSKEIHDLHKNIIDVLNPLREGLLRPHNNMKTGTFSNEQKENIATVGFKDAHELYRPHLTFSRLDKYDRGVLLKINQVDFSFTVDTIGLFSLGEHGTAIETIQKFNLIVGDR